MSILSIVLLVFFVLISLLLVFLVIVQDEDSDSLGGIFAGGSGSAFGSRSSNVIIRFTYILGALFFVLAFSLALLNKSSLGNIKSGAPAETQQSGDWWSTKPAETAPASGQLQGAAPDAAAPQTGGN